MRPAKMLPLFWHVNERLIRHIAAMLTIRPHLLRIRMFAVCLAVLLGLPGVSAAATFNGQFWDLNSPNGSIDEALLAIDGVTPTATFISTAIDYPNGGQNIVNSQTTLAQFLGADALSIVGDATARITTSVFRFSGFLDLIPGQQNFALGSDDGYRLTINNNVISEQNRPRSFRTTALNSDAASGRVPFELIFYENFGRTGVEFFIDNVLAEPAPIPLPGGLSLSLTGLAAFGLLRRRRRAQPTKLALAKAI